METTARTVTGADGARIVGTDKKDFFEKDGPGPRIMAADTLEGNTVPQSGGRQPRQHRATSCWDVPPGRIAYAVMSFGGFLGMGDKLFARPVERVDAGHRPQVLRAQRQQGHAGKGAWL